MSTITPATTTTFAIVDLAAADGDLTRALAALDAVPSLNLVAMPELATSSGAVYESAVAAVAAYCAKRRAFFIVDPPADWTSVDAVASGIGRIAPIVKENGAIYWPPLANGEALSPAVAKVYIATDQASGVWKAPAGTTAVMPDAIPSYKLTDDENGVLNPLAVNCIRTFPVYGTVVWGARTLDGADALQSDWKYVPVRRLALYIHSSIAQSLTWAADVPNAEALWKLIRAVVNEFMRGLQSTGACYSFFVNCDSTTTTPADIENGIVNVVVGFAPVKPTEFVILYISAIAAA